MRAKFQQQKIIRNKQNDYIQNRVLESEIKQNNFIKTCIIMHEQESFDLLSEVQIPPWMIQNLNNFKDVSNSFQNEDHLNHLLGNQNQSHLNGDNQELKTHNSYQIQWNERRQHSEDGSDESQGEKMEREKNSHGTKKQSKNKQQRRNQISRKYRQRKKQHSRQLQNQNKFLKFKVDELTFRLQQVTTELNKLKNTSQSQNLPNYHKVKSQCFQQLQKMLQKNVQDVGSYIQIEKKINEIVGFDGKQKIDLLNYFMSELMENVITDKVFYFIDGLINKKGVHRPNEHTKLSQLDQQIFDILKLHDNKKQQQMKKINWQSVNTECKKFQQLWKTLYQVYLAILNQGFKIQRTMEKVRNSLQNFINVTDMLKLQLYFEKNKYRADIREMRNLWFRELERQKVPNQWKKVNTA